MRETRSSGSVEGGISDGHSYSDSVHQHSGRHVARRMGSWRGEPEVGREGIIVFGMRIAVITVPYDAGRRSVGVGLGPARLLQAGLPNQPKACA